VRSRIRRAPSINVEALWSSAGHHLGDPLELIRLALICERYRRVEADAH
jgi:hypothetical protein